MSNRPLELQPPDLERYLTAHLVIAWLAQLLLNPDTPALIERAKRSLRTRIADLREHRTALDRWADDGGPCP